MVESMTADQPATSVSQPLRNHPSKVNNHIVLDKWVMHIIAIIQLIIENDRTFLIK